VEPHLGRDVFAWRRAGVILRDLLTLCRAHAQENLPAKIEYQSMFKAIIGVFEACTSSLADLRRGISIFAECSGVGYNNVRPFVTRDLRFALS